MASSFWLNAPQFPSDSAFRAEVRAHTGSEEEADSILRSIERLGGDPSIHRYEMTPSQPRAFARPVRVSWSVRAVRP